MSIEKNYYYIHKYTEVEVEIEIGELIEAIDYYEDNRLLFENEEVRLKAYKEYARATKLLDEAMRYYAYLR